MGGQKAIAYFYAALSELVDVTVVSTKNNQNPNQLNSEFLPIISNKVSRYFNPFLFFKIRGLIKKRNTTHLILEHPYLGWLGLLLKWFSKTKLVVRSHNIESLRFKSIGKWWWRILWYYEKVIHQNADINFFITDEDKNYAIDKFDLKTEKCITITYGLDFNNPPSKDEREVAKNSIKKTHEISQDELILMFNGTLDYKPNLDAVNHILHDINPILLSHSNFKYKILICGKGLPASYNHLSAQQNIIYTGFVDDISLYFKGADIFINPVIDGGGIKTKLVEALGYNLYTVSTFEGAMGVPVETTNNRMALVKSDEWNSFANNIIEAKIENSAINTEFFDYFYWGKIAEKACHAFENQR